MYFVQHNICFHRESKLEKLFTILSKKSFLKIVMEFVSKVRFTQVISGYVDTMWFYFVMKFIHRRTVLSGAQVFTS